MVLPQLLIDDAQVGSSNGFAYSANGWGPNTVSTGTSGMMLGTATNLLHPSSTVSVSFEGTGIDIYGAIDCITSTACNFQYSLDNSPSQTASASNGTSTIVLFNLDNLSDSTHTLLLSDFGIAGVSLDFALISLSADTTIHSPQTLVVKSNDPSITYSGNWADASQTGAHIPGKQSTHAGDSLSCQFAGDSVSILGSWSNSQSGSFTLSISLDDQTPSTHAFQTPVNLPSSETPFYPFFHTDNIQGSGQHKIVITIQDISNGQAFQFGQILYSPTFTTLSSVGGSTSSNGGGDGGAPGGGGSILSTSPSGSVTQVPASSPSSGVSLNSGNSNANSVSGSQAGTNNGPGLSATSVGNRASGSGSSYPKETATSSSTNGTTGDGNGNGNGNGTANSDAPKHHKAMTGAIIGTCIAVAVILAMIYLYIRRRKRIAALSKLNDDEKARPFTLKRLFDNPSARWLALNPQATTTDHKGAPKDSQAQTPSSEAGKAYPLWHVANDDNFDCERLSVIIASSPVDHRHSRLRPEPEHFPSEKERELTLASESSEIADGSQLELSGAVEPVQDRANLSSSPVPPQSSQPPVTRPALDAPAAPEGATPLAASMASPSHNDLNPGPASGVQNDTANELTLSSGQVISMIQSLRAQIDSLQVAHGDSVNTPPPAYSSS